MRLKVEQIMIFLYIGKSDEIGSFLEIPDKLGNSLSNTNVDPSSLDKEIQEFICSRKNKNVATILCLSHTNTADITVCDLFLSSRDINRCNFSKQLAECLTLENSKIHVECSELNNRGLNRLHNLLNKLKELFDHRVIVILTSISFMPECLGNISDKELNDRGNGQKKAKIDHEIRMSEKSKLFVGRNDIQDNVSSNVTNDYELEASVVNLDDNKKILAQKRKDLNEEIFELEKEITNLENLKRTIVESRSELNSLTSEKTGLIEYLNNLKSSISHSESVHSELLTLNDKMSLEIRSLKTEKMELSRFLEENKEKLHNTSMPGSCSCKQNELCFVTEHASYSLNSDDSLQDQAEELEKIKSSIVLNQQLYPAAQSPEIMQRSIPKLHFTSSFENKQDGVVFSVTVLKPNCLRDKFKQTSCFGRSKKIAKINLFDSFIQSIKSM